MQGELKMFAGMKFDLRRKKFASCLFYLSSQEKGFNATEGFGKVIEVV